MIAKFVIERGEVTADEVSWQLKTYTGWVITVGFRDVQFSKVWVGPAGQQMEWELLRSTEGVTDHVFTLGVLEPLSTLTATLQTASLKHYHSHSAIKELSWLRCSISLYIPFDHRTDIELKGSVAQCGGFGANDTAKQNNYSILSTRFLFCMISGFCHEVDEIYALLGYCAVYSGVFILLTMWGAFILLTMWGVFILLTMFHC